MDHNDLLAFRLIELIFSKQHLPECNDPYISNCNIRTSELQNPYKRPFSGPASALDDLQTDSGTRQSHRSSAVVSPLPARHSKKSG